MKKSFICPLRLALSVLYNVYAKMAKMHFEERGAEKEGRGSYKTYIKRNGLGLERKMF